MKSEITIQFKRILRQKVNEKLLKENPALFDTTAITMSKLCDTIKKYFQERHIEVEITQGLYKNGN